MKRYLFRLVLPTALVIGLLAVISAALGSDEPPTIRVGHVGHDHQIALYVAAEAGKSLESEYGVYLEELKPQEVYNLYDGGKLMARVHMVRVGGGSKMPAALEQGDIEVGLGGLGPVAKFVDKGTEIKVLAPLNNDGDALIMGKDFKGEGWSDFVKAARASEKPLRIGYKAPMAVAYMIFVRALDEEGLLYGPEPMTADGKPVDVITVNMQGLDNSLPSLESGVVDGVVANEPMGSILVHKGVGKRVADLSTLPPDGKWDGHPCCIVTAREDALKEKRPIIVSLLKVIAAGGDIIARDKAKALDAETKWTRTDPQVGIESIANVDYVILPDGQWIKGVDTWLEMMTESGHFKKRFKDKSTDEIKSGMLDLAPMNEAVKDMKLKSVNK